MVQDLIIISEDLAWESLVNTLGIIEKVCWLASEKGFFNKEHE